MTQMHPDYDNERWNVAIRVVADDNDLDGGVEYAITDDGRWRAGDRNEAIAAALRDLADHVESGKWDLYFKPTEESPEGPGVCVRKRYEDRVNALARALGSGAFRPDPPIRTEAEFHKRYGPKDAPCARCRTVGVPIDGSACLYCGNSLATLPDTKDAP